MKTVLHIAAHMGGGVGKVLSNVALYKESEYQHHIILLEKPIDTVFTDKLSPATLTVAPSIDVIEDLVRCADIVQFDYWNHPLLAKVMSEVQDIPMRSVVWSHTAGCYYPYIKPDFVTMPDHFIFSSAYSRDNPHWSPQDIHQMRNISVINSSGGFKDTQDVALMQHKGFNVGYVGTLGYVKLLPEFIEYCKAISDIPGIRFTMIGRIPEPNLVMRDAERAGIADKFTFKGWVPDLPKELAQMDVLGYLLNPHHFGTTENAMLEAMSMGIPPVCIDQCAEKHLISHGETGYLVRCKDDYRQALRNLHAHRDVREAVGRNARRFVLGELQIDNTVSKLDKVYDAVIHNRKRQIHFTSVFGPTPYDWYRAGLPPARCGSQVVSKYLVDSTKGSVSQWQKYYRADERLATVQQ